MDLPPKVLAQIFKAPPPGGLIADLPAVKVTCKAFQDAVTGDDGLRRMDRLLPLVHKLAARDFDSRLSLLPLLPPKLNKRIEDYFAGWVDDVRDVAKGLAHLKDKSVRAWAVRTSILSERGKTFVESLEKLAPELSHVNETQREHLARKALGLADKGLRARAIDALGGALAQLKPETRKDMLAAAILMGDDGDRARAIAGMCKGLKYLDADDQKTLFEAATRIPLGQWHRVPIGDLGGSLGALSREQRATLVTLTLELHGSNLGNGQDRHHHAFQATRGLAEGLEHLEPQQIDALVTASTQPGFEDCVYVEGAFAALGRKLRVLTEAQQGRLLDAVACLDDGTCYDRVVPIVGFAAGFGSLDRSERKDQLGKRLVDMALGLRYDRAQALGALGASLGDLTLDLRRVLVKEAISLLKDGLGLREARALSAGLGAGWAGVPSDLRHELMELVRGWTSLKSRDKDRLAFAVEAIAGLGAALPHLDEAEFETLLEKVIKRLPLKLIEGADMVLAMEFERVVGWQEIALRGFAAEAAKAVTGAPRTV